MATWQSSLISSATKRDKDPFGPSASEITPRLFLSNFLFARSAEAMQAQGITHVISVIEQRPVYPPSLKGTLHIPLTDTSDADILQYLDATTAFITTALAENSDNRVLVHCLMGISRSATVVCAYLIATNSMSARESVDFVMSKRSIICPNLGFRRQLEAYGVRFHSGKGFAARGAAKITGVSEGIVARIRKLKRRTRDDGRSSQEDEETITKIASVAVTVESVHMPRHVTDQHS